MDGGFSFICYCRWCDMMYVMMGKGNDEWLGKVLQLPRQNSLSVTRINSNVYSNQLKWHQIGTFSWKVIAQQKNHFMRNRRCKGGVIITNKQTETSHYILCIGIGSSQVKSNCDLQFIVVDVMFFVNFLTCVFVESTKPSQAPKSQP